MQLVITILLSVLCSYVKGQTTEAPNYSCNESNSAVQFTLYSSPHSARQPASNCSLQQCHVNSNLNNSCRSSSTPYFDYRTPNNSRYCAPGVVCSILEACDNITYTCASNTSLCVVNSCCSPQAVCLPLLLTNLCIPEWTLTSPMNNARHGHTASVLTNEQVLVTGGDSNFVLFSAELYDRLTGTWTFTSNLNNRRYLHTASVLTNGQVLVSGGSDNSQFLNSAELY